MCYPNLGNLIVLLIFGLGALGCASPGLTTPDCAETRGAALVDPAKCSERGKREIIFQRCSSNIALSAELRTENYLILINDNHLAQYDENCNVSLDSSEIAQFAKDQTEKAVADLPKRVAAVRKRTAYQQESLSRKFVEEPTESALLDVYPSQAIKDNSVSVSYKRTGDAAQDAESYGLKFAFFQHPWRQPTSNSLISVGADIALQRDWSRTDSAIATSRAVDLVPFSWKFGLRRDLDFSLGAGAAYVWTEKTDLGTGEITKARDPGYLYTAALQYKTRWECLSLALEYKTRLRRGFSDRLSYSWLPMIKFDFTKSCGTR